MMKGLPQEKRNSAWHKKHLAKRTKFNIHRVSRVFNYSSGITATARAKARMLKLMDKQRDKDLTRGFWNRLKLWLNKLFNFNLKPNVA